MEPERTPQLTHSVGGRRPDGAVGWRKLLRDFSGYDSLVFAKTTRRHIMAWTEITRMKYRRDGLRYASKRPVFPV